MKFSIPVFSLKYLSIPGLEPGTFRYASDALLEAREKDLVKKINNISNFGHFWLKSDYN